MATFTVYLVHEVSTVVEVEVPDEHGLPSAEELEGLALASRDMPGTWLVAGSGVDESGEGWSAVEITDADGEAYWTRDTEESTTR